jgi:predicted nucleotidyltransferase
MHLVVHPIVQARLPELQQLCARFRVSRLELFGSATSTRFDPSSSDLDFLVEFQDLGHGYFDAYFGLLEALEALFGRPVDLVMSRAVTNPYFLEGIQASRTVVYAA